MTTTTPHQPSPTALFYRDHLTRESEASLARLILSGTIVCRPTDFVLPTGAATNALFKEPEAPLQQVPVASVLIFTAPAFQCRYLDTLTTLLLRDRFLRLKQRQTRQNKATENTDAALSFCKGTLALLRRLDPKGYALSLSSLYPAITARPKRVIADTKRLATSSLQSSGL